MKLAIVSGGTGGHIYPGIAVADELKRQYPSAEILFLGSAEGLESDVVPKAGYRIELIRSRALLRKVSYKSVSAPFVSLIGFFQSLVILRRFRPQAVLSTGGYASLPVVLAAKLLGLPFYLHEQNVLPGVTNRFYARWAREVFLSFAASRTYLPGTVTGNPVRREILAADRESSRKKFGYGPADRVVFIMGGSQGAKRINDVVGETVREIAESRKQKAEHRDLKIVHVIGRRDWPGFKDQGSEFYRPLEYLYNIGEVLAAADLVVSRAGATALAEFACRGLPMVLVPFPFSAEGHQDLNARAVEEAGAGLTIKNSEFTPERFLALISGRQLDLGKMGAAAKRLGRSDAAAKIVERMRWN